MSGTDVVKAARSQHETQIQPAKLFFWRRWNIGLQTARYRSNAKAARWKMEDEESIMSTLW